MMKSTSYFASACAVLFIALAPTGARGDEVSNPPAEKIVQQLESDNPQVRANAETQLFELGGDAVDALVDAACRDPSPDRVTVEAVLRILRKWEADSWTNPHSEAAIDRFVELVRDPENYSGEHAPLSPDAPYAFAEAVRVLDVPPEQAASYLREKGVSISTLPGGYYSAITFPRDWIPDPRDWLYLANLARKVFERHHPILIKVVGPIEGDTLVECLKYFRKSKNHRFHLSLNEAEINRELLAVLGSYRELRRFAAFTHTAAVPDEDWAAGVASWPQVQSLDLPAGGPKTIAAASELENLMNLKLRDPSITEDDLEPLRDHEKLRVLWVFDGKREVQYLNRDGTGKWQLEAGKKELEPTDE